MASIKESLAEFPIQTEIEVQWGDMDAAQHVNNVIYLRWAESSRIAYFDALGRPVTPEGNQAGFILGWQDCKYLFPVRYPDRLTIGIRVVEIGEDRFLMESHFYSQKHQRLVAISKQRVVTYDYVALKKVPVPETIKQGILRLEGKE
ncbi:MAG: thioesterase family protein [Bacteroidota bacterium]